MTRPADHALLFATEDTYARGVAVAMRSALTHLSPASTADVYVLDSGLSNSSRSRLERVFARSRGGGELHFVDVPGHIERLPRSERFPPSVYAKLLIADLLPPHVRRLVCLDADLVVTGDLSLLFTIDLGGSPIGAVRDEFIGTTDDERSGIRERTPPRPYFNAGVLAVDMAAWRTHRVTERVLDYIAADTAQLRWPDQDALNAVVGDWRELDRRWNFQTRNVRSEGGDDSPVVVHFVGPKPWDHRCLTPGSAAWGRTLVGSGWYRFGEAAEWLVTHHAAKLKYRVSP
jgi:lipopolysaccharide biosynthesis glycosyltransferase